MCFLQFTSLELTDSALHQASRSSRDPLRRAAERAERRRTSTRISIVQAAAKAKLIRHAKTRDWLDRAIEARALLDAFDAKQGMPKPARRSRKTAGACMHA